MSGTGTGPVIIQIAVSSPDGDSPGRLYALAADGTLWVRVVKRGYGWHQIPTLPEPGATPTGPALVDS